MDGSRAAAMQLQLRQNAEDLQDYLRDLETWESEIKKKDDTLRRQKPILKETLPPVRSQRSQATSKKKKKKKHGTSEKPPRISSYDFQSWDKFDVEKACEEVEYEVQSSSGSEEEEEDEVLEEERRKQEALLEKEKGNVLFKEGKFELAVECYTMAMELDPLSAVMPANRALALLKLERYAAAESDCSMAIALDDSYVKAYLRRGTARTNLEKLKEAKEDFDTVLRLEPGNKQAKSDVMKLEKQLSIIESGSVAEKSRKTPNAHVSAVKRPPHLRSKKPLKRIAIEEVGEEEPVARTDASQPSSTLTAQLVEAAVECPKSSEKVLPEVPSHDKDSFSTVQTGKAQPSLEDGVVGNRAPSDHSMATDKTEPGQEEVFRLPPVPDSSIQFQADWKSLRRNRTTLSGYFKALPPSKYPSLLQQSLETDIFPEIISILHEDYVRCGKLCLEQLRWLTKVKRFSVAVMFLSKKEKESLCQLFKDLHNLVSNDTEHLELQALAKVFSVKL